ncbi:MAG TPA: SDR family NAD(P)-dependent oxidoreductase [Deltaproteobacteria bacterium]|nr:SDR family NAD(P)-dependent oxidoreductase [Deltaproteobacteria bacterium]
MKRLDVKGAAVLVTGSARGIGMGLAEQFASRGANLVLVDLPSERESLERLAGRLEREYAVRTWIICSDLTAADGPERVLCEVERGGIRVSVLVNNAGICWYGRFHEMPLDRLFSMILLNCVAYAKMARLFLPMIMESREGGVLNVSSVSAFQPVPTLALYAATKAFTQSLTEAIRLELPSSSRVRVATLNPPFTRTSLIDDAGVPGDYVPMKMSLMEVHDVVHQGVEAFVRGRTRHVPGLFNKVLYQMLLPVTPRMIMDALTRVLTMRLSDILPGILALFGPGRSAR